MDVNLVNAIKNARPATRAATDPVTCGDLAELTTLEAADKGIRSLTGLNYATKLETLDLTGNQVRDVRPLAPLTRLTQLILKDNRIADLTPVLKAVGNRSNVSIDVSENCLSLTTDPALKALTSLKVDLTASDQRTPCPP